MRSKIVQLPSWVFMCSFLFYCFIMQTAIYEAINNSASLDDVTADD